MLVKLDIFPKFRGKDKKHVWNHHLVTVRTCQNAGPEKNERIVFHQISGTSCQFQGMKMICQNYDISSGKDKQQKSKHYLVMLKKW